MNFSSVDVHYDAAPLLGCERLAADTTPTSSRHLRRHGPPYSDVLIDIIARTQEEGSLANSRLPLRSVLHVDSLLSSLFVIFGAF